MAISDSDNAAAFSEISQTRIFDAWLVGRCGRRCWRGCNQLVSQAGSERSRRPEGIGAATLGGHDEMVIEQELVPQPITGRHDRRDLLGVHGVGDAPLGPQPDPLATFRSSSQVRQQRPPRSTMCPAPLPGCQQITQIHAMTLMELVERRDRRRCCRVAFASPAQDPRHLRHGAGGVFPLQRHRRSSTCASVRAANLRGAGTSASNPPAR